MRELDVIEVPQHGIGRRQIHGPIVEGACPEFDFLGVALGAALATHVGGHRVVRQAGPPVEKRISDTSNTSPARTSQAVRRRRGRAGEGGGSGLRGRSSAGGVLIEWLSSPTVIPVRPIRGRDRSSSYTPPSMPPRLAFAEGSELRQAIQRSPVDASKSAAQAASSGPSGGCGSTR